MSPPVNSFVNSKPTSSEWEGGSDNFLVHTDEGFIQAVKRGEDIASILLFNHDGHPIIGYAPRISNDEFGHPEKLVFSLHDNTYDTPMFGSVNLNSIGMFATVVEVNSLPGFPTNEIIPTDFLKKTVYKNREENYQAVGVPNYVVFPHRVTPPQIDDISQDDLSQIQASHGKKVFSILSAIQGMFDHEDFTKKTKVVDNIITAGQGEALISPLLAGDKVQLLSAVPAVILSMITKSTKLPNDVAELGQIFGTSPVPPPPQLNQIPTNVQQQASSSNTMSSSAIPTNGVLPSSSGQQQIVIVQQSNDNKAESEKDLDDAARSMLFHISGTVNSLAGGGINVSNLTLPEKTSNFQGVLKTSRALRPERGKCWLQHSMKAIRKGSSSLNQLKTLDMTEFSKASATALINSNYDTNSLADIPEKSTQVSILTFGPQSISLSAVQEIRTANLNASSESQNNIREEDKSKTSTVVHGSCFRPRTLGEVNTTLINFHAAESVQYNLLASLPLVLQAIAILRETISDNTDWISKYHNQMPWLYETILSRAQMIIAAFASISESYDLRTALSTHNPTNDVLRAAITPETLIRITQAVSIAHSFKSDVGQSIIAQRALSAHAHCPSSYVPSDTAEEVVEPSVPDRPSRRQQQSKRPVSASAETQQRRTDYRRDQTRRPVPVSSGKKETEMGIIHLAIVSTPPGQIFPRELEVTFFGKTAGLCAGFCCQGRSCNRRATNCSFLHVPRYDMLGQEPFDTLCKHLSDTKVGWLNDRMLKASQKIVLKPEYEHLRGNENGPFVTPTNVVPSDMEVEAMQKVEASINVRVIHTNLSLPTSELEDHVPSVDRIMNSLPLTTQTKKKSEVILDQYQQRFGGNSSRPIVSSTRGKKHQPPTILPNKLVIFKNHPIKPSQLKSYETEPSFELVSFVLAKYIINEKTDCIHTNGWREVLQTMSLLNRDFNTMVNDIFRLRTIDFSPLKLPRFNFNDQVEIDVNRVDMATALMIQADLHPGIAIRYLSGEYTAEHRDVDSILSYVDSHLDPDDVTNIKNVLVEGAPSSFSWEEPRDNKLTRLELGNQPSVERNHELVRKTINKEDRNSHVLPMAKWMPRFSPWCRHNYQGLVTKNGKARVVWDETTVPASHPHLIVMNKIAAHDGILRVAYGDVVKRFMISILNMRASFPDEDIFIPAADITACFRWPRTHPDLSGGLGFILQDYYHLAIGMVFGHVESAATWEPIRLAIEKMALVEFNGPKNLEDIHKYYLDLLNWEDFDRPEPPPGTLQRSARCSKITGVLDTDGQFMQPKPGIFVDDALLASIRRFIKRLLASIIEAIFNIMGKPDEAVRRNHLSMEKWINHKVSWCNTLVGFDWDTRSLRVGIPSEYIGSVRQLMNKDGWTYRKTFTVPQISRLVGKVGHIAQAVPWVYHLMSHLYAAISYALTRNKKSLAANSREFKDLLKVVKGQASHEILTNAADGQEYIQSNIVAFATSRLAKMPHHSNAQYPITIPMKDQLQVLDQFLSDPTIKWSSPIAHNVERDPTARSLADSCLDEMGGFSTHLKFMWHVPFPDEICKRTIRFIERGPKQISINVLEFAAIIVNYAAALVAITLEFPEDDPYPILLNMADNKSAVKWVRLCTESAIGRRLAILFCFLIMDEPLGINAKWIAGEENIIADALSQIPCLAQLSNLPAESIATFAYLEHYLDREYADSKGSEEVERERSRQSNYISFAERHRLPDPCGQGPAWDRILAHYLKEVCLGINIYNKDSLRSDTIRGYAKAAIKLFRLREFPAPFDFNDTSSMAATVLNNYEEQEDIASQRLPLDDHIFAQILQISSSSDFLSKECCLSDIIILSRYLGFRLSEYGQKSHSKIELHNFPDGRSIIKAITTQDLVFTGKDGTQLTRFDPENIQHVVRLTVTFRIQKNRRNGEKKHILPDSNNPEMCPVRAALRLVQRAQELEQLQSNPCAVYQNKGNMTYVTGKDMSSFLQNMATMAYPGMPKSDIKRYTSHSLRVTAAVLLHEEGHDGDYIKIQLRWLGESYRVYLRSTLKVLQKHTNSLAKSAAVSIRLANLSQNVSHSATEIDPTDMGSYEEF